MKIALIGAGPRGLITLGRLVALQPVSTHRRLDITVFDPYPAGGRVWQTGQNAHLIMNTPAQHITLFYDQSVQDPGPLTTGPNLAKWAHTLAADFIGQQPAFPNQAVLMAEAATLQPNDYTSRALYGAYCQWFTETLLENLPVGVTVNYEQTSVTAVHPQTSGYQVVTDELTFQADAVAMALGNIENSLTRDQEELASFASEHDYLYLPPNFPADLDLSAIKSSDEVILRGLGMSFFDFTILLTEGRGGTFTKTADGLVYHPSGREPHIVGGSRRGFPYHAKGRNQKSAGEQVHAHFLTDQQIADWAKQRPIPGKVFWQAMQHEMEYTYYTLLLQKYPQIDLPTFQNDFLNNPDKTLRELTIKDSDRLNWDQVINPATDNNADFESLMKQYLTDDIDAALLGTKTGPLTAALEVLRDLRDPVRKVLAAGLLTDDEYLDFFLRTFNGINNFLSIGPPVMRTQQLLALMDAGIVSILPPQMRVEGKNGYFEATSAVDKSVVYHGTALIEARMTAVNAPTAQNPLLQQLLHDGLAAPYELQLAGERRFQSGAILIDQNTCRLINSHGQYETGLYFWGVPTEGASWLTTASPRPHVNHIVLRQANHIAREMLGIMS